MKRPTAPCSVSCVFSQNKHKDFRVAPRASKGCSHAQTTERHSRSLHARMLARVFTSLCMQCTGCKRNSLLLAEQARSLCSLFLGASLKLTRALCAWFFFSLSAEIAAAPRKQMQRSPSAAPPANAASPLAIPPTSKIKTKALPALPAAQQSPFIPVLKLEKLIAASRAAELSGNDMQKAGEEVARSMSDLFKNLGSSMDNVLKGEFSPEKEPPAKRERGTIVA